MPSADNELTKSIKALMRQREEIEKDISTRQAILDKNNFKVGDSFVDAEDYPRNDIDVYEVRRAVHEIVYLQNDYKSLMKKIEDKLEELHLYYKENKEKEPGPPYAGDETDLKHFAIIRSLAPDSPASAAGLVDGDKLIKFGSLNTSNFKEYKDFAEVVENSFRKTILVQVARNGRLLEFYMTPNSWQGPGWLGCRVLIPEKQS